MNKEEILNLLKKASHNYYNNLDLIMTDEEYDRLMTIAEMNGWIEQDELLNDGAIINSETEVNHDIPMLSLEKAKDEISLKAYYDRCVKAGAKTFSIEPKLDGMALSLKYKDGKLIYLATRGNGEKGENLNYLLNERKLGILNLPLILEDKEITEIRGELFCSKNQLIKNNQEKKENTYPNERVAVVGIVKKAKLGLQEKAELTFNAYSVYRKNELLFNYNNNDIVLAKSLFPNNVLSSFNELINEVHKAKKYLKEIDVPTDGVVIKPNESINLGATSHHRKEFIAYKYPSTIKSSKIKDISFSVGKTGSITPKIEIEPIEIDGVVVKYLTGHNYEWLTKQNIRVGATAFVTRSNDVIPAVLYVDNFEDKKVEKAPSVCPHCNSKLMGDLKTLSCNNYSCPSRINFFMSYIVKVFEIDGISSSLIESLNMKSIVDLVNLKLTDLKDTKYNNNISLGEKRAEKIYNQIINIKENSEEYKWLLSLNFDRVGQVNAKAIIKHFGSIQNFLYNENLENELKKIEGVGTTTISTIKEKLKDSQSIYEDLVKLGVKFNSVNYNKILIGSYSHTGNVPNKFKNRKELIDYMESLGYKFSSSINSKVEFLLCENKDSTSSKIKKANDLNIPIITWEDFENRG